MLKTVQGPFRFVQQSIGERESTWSDAERDHIEIVEEGWSVVYRCVAIVGASLFCQFRESHFAKFSYNGPGRPLEEHGGKSRQVSEAVGMHWQVRRSKHHSRHSGIVTWIELLSIHCISMTSILRRPSIVFTILYKKCSPSWKTCMLTASALCDMTVNLVNGSRRRLEYHMTALFHLFFSLSSLIGEF